MTLRSWLHDISKRIKFLPWIGEQPYTEMLFWQFSNINIYIKIVENIPDQHLNVWLISKTNFFSVDLHFFGPCPLDLGITIHSNIDLVFFQKSWRIWLCWKIAWTTLQCMVILQSRGRNFILVEISWSQDLRVEHKAELL